MLGYKTVEEIRQPWESNDMWGLRKSFLEKHWENLPQDRLICLSQVFINMEFMGCVYPEEVAEEVKELCDGLAEERNVKRKEVVEKIFGGNKALMPGGGRVSYQGKKSTQTGTDVAKAAMKAEAESMGPPSKILDASKSSKMKNPFEAPAPKKAKASVVEEEISKSAECVAMESVMMTVRAQISVVDNVPRSQPIQFLNHACSRSKFEWESEFVTVDDSRSELYIAVGNVVVARLAVPLGVDRNAAKIVAAELTLKTLESKCLAVRKESPSHESLAKKWKFALYTTADKRVSDFKGPDTNIFAYYEQQMGQLRDTISESSGTWDQLTEATESLGIDCKVETKQKTGWKVQLELKLLSSLIVAFGEYNAKKEEEYKNSLAQSAVALLLKSHHRVWESDSGNLYLLAADTPITDENIAKHIPKNIPKGNIGHPEIQLPGTSKAHLEDIASRLIIFKYPGDEFKDSAIGILTRSYQLSKSDPIVFDFHPGGKGGSRCSVTFEGLELASEVAENKKLAKHEAAKTALAVLKRICYTLLVKDVIDPSQTEISFGDLGGGPSEAKEALPESNIGNKMMKKMGWGGGGMGASEQGIKEPISVVQIMGRSGLGLASETGVTRQFTAAVTAVLQEYAHSSRNTDLVFSSEFSSDQRKKIHSIAQRIKTLKSVSYGKGDDRQLTIQRKRSGLEVAEYIRSIGGENAKYKLIPPQS